MRRSLPIVQAVEPGRKWRWARRLTQGVAFVALVVGPFLGGWQRLERHDLASWEGAFDLPAGVRQHLPAGDPAHTAYEVNVLLGGGSVMHYVSVAGVDPVAGVAALSAGRVTPPFLAALGLTLLVALLMGRVFCGWICPFGTISRGLRALLNRLPWRPPSWKLPRRRWLRFGLLLSGMAGAAFGFEMVLYLALPHVVVQQSAYSLWLLGGGGAILGWLAGLLLAGLIFGPTTYCATLCPTGAGLSLLGRLKRTHLTLASADDCGTRCNLCSRVCWLGLEPSSGDPGPDCDTCARCVPICPKKNLRVGLLTGLKRKATIVSLLLLLPALFLLLPSTAGATPNARRIDPLLVLDELRNVGEVQVAISLVDLTGVRLDANDPSTLSGHRLSFVVYRDGTPEGEVYTKALQVSLYRNTGGVQQLTLPEPNHPSSTPRRAVYRTMVPALDPGDRIELARIEGWFDAPVSWRVPALAPGKAPFGFFWSLIGASILFSGLLSLALSLSNGAVPPSRVPAR